MGRSRSPNRDKAFEIFKEHHGKISTKEIADLLGEKERTVTFWRYADDWKDNYNPEGGAPKGNQNAVGKVGGAPLRNQNARKDGWYSQYLPYETRNIVKELQDADASALDILWAQIVTQWAAIMRAQKIMFVTDKDEMIKELKKKKTVDSDKISSEEIEYEFQFAWDRQATFLNAQSRAMAQLTNMLKRYDEMLNMDRDMVTEEQRLRVERLKLQIQNPELQHKKEHDEKKLQLDKERFEHQKKIDESKVW